MKGAKLFVVGETWERAGTGRGTPPRGGSASPCAEHTPAPLPLRTVRTGDDKLVHEDVPLARGPWSSLTAQVVRREPDATLDFCATMVNGWPCLLRSARYRGAISLFY